MKQQILAFLSALLFITFFVSCKKDVVTNETTILANESIKQKAKDWFKAQSQIQVGQATKSTNSLVNDEIQFNSKAGKPKWEDTKYENNISITPIVSASRSTLLFKKYFVAQYKDNSIINGYITVVVDKNSHFPEISSEILSANKISNFTGTILNYDLRGNRISSKHFDNGEIVKNKEDKLVDKLKEENNGNSGNVAPIEGCYWIDHWWVTWNLETGEVITIEYEGSTEVCNGGGGSSGGGGGGESPNCESQMNQMILGGPAQQLRSITTISENSVQRIKEYKWICYINYGGWGLLSTDRGKHLYEYTASPNTPDWKWDSFHHISLAKEGMTIGGSVSYDDVTPTPTLGLYHAVMNLQINLKFSLVCQYTPSLRDITVQCNKMFNVNQGEVVNPPDL